jgi:hypothetical protein
LLAVHFQDHEPAIFTGDVRKRAHVENSLADVNRGLIAVGNLRPAPFRLSAAILLPRIQMSAVRGSPSLRVEFIAVRVEAILDHRLARVPFRGYSPPDEQSIETFRISLCETSEDSRKRATRVVGTD